MHLRAAGCVDLPAKFGWPICYDCHVGKSLMRPDHQRAIELSGDIDDQHRLLARVPEQFPSGPVRLIVLMPDEDEAGGAWTQVIADAWSDDLRDSRQDIYTLEDGRPSMRPVTPPSDLN